MRAERGEAGPRRVLFVFAWLVVGGEETEVRLLARHLDPARYRIDVVACLRKPDMPEQTHAQLAALGVDVDTAPYALSFEDTVAYLTRKIPGYDIVVGCQNVADLYPALERLRLTPPLIEHGGLVEEALAGRSTSPPATSACAAASATRPPAAWPVAPTTRWKFPPWWIWGKPTPPRGPIPAAAAPARPWGCRRTRPSSAGWDGWTARSGWRTSSAPRRWSARRRRTPASW